MSEVLKPFLKRHSHLYDLSLGGRAARRQRRTESLSITIKLWFSCIWSNQQWQLVLSTSAFIHQKLTRLFEFNWLVELWWQKPITRNLTMYPMADLWNNHSPIRLNCRYPTERLQYSLYEKCILESFWISF